MTETATPTKYSFPTREAYEEVLDALRPLRVMMEPFYSTSDNRQFMVGQELDADCRVTEQGLHHIGDAADAAERAHATLIAIKEVGSSIDVYPIGYQMHVWAVLLRLLSEKTVAEIDGDVLDALAVQVKVLFMDLVEGSLTVEESNSEEPSGEEDADGVEQSEDPAPTVSETEPVTPMHPVMEAERVRFRAWVSGGMSGERPVVTMEDVRTVLLDAYRPLATYLEPFEQLSGDQVDSERRAALAHGADIAERSAEIAVQIHSRGWTGASVHYDPIEATDLLHVVGASMRQAVQPTDTMGFVELAGAQAWVVRMMYKRIVESGCHAPAESASA